MSRVASLESILSCTPRCFIVHLMHRSSFFFFFFQAEDGIRDLVRSRWLGDVDKSQGMVFNRMKGDDRRLRGWGQVMVRCGKCVGVVRSWLLYTSDAADDLRR